MTDRLTPTPPAARAEPQPTAAPGEETHVQRAIADLRFYAARLVQDKPDVYDVRITMDRTETRLSDSVRVVLAALTAATARVREVEAERGWKWFGNAGHLIVGEWCRFHLTTQVGDYLVSTVGEYWPERPSREIHARIHDVAWLAENAHRKGDDFDAAYMRRFGYHTVGCDRLYETMVFRAGEPCNAPGCGCGLPKIDGHELDFGSYNDAASAARGHMELCEKWSRAALRQEEPRE